LLARLDGAFYITWRGANEDDAGYPSWMSLGILKDEVAMMRMPDDYDPIESKTGTNLFDIIYVRVQSDSDRV
jgi:hypothetical protein